MKQRSTQATEHITARFRAAAVTYDQQPGVQPAVAEKVASMIAASGCLRADTHHRILEVGCGTGTLTALLTVQFPAAQILAVDIAETMIERARQRLGNPANVTWRTVDVQHLSVANHSFALVASSSALHWVQPLEPALARLAAALKPGGLFVGGLMTCGTLAELHALRRDIAPGKSGRMELPDKKDVLDAVLGAGFANAEVIVETVVVRYPSAVEFLKILNRQGVTGGMYGPQQVLNRSELRRLLQEYEKRHSHPDGGVVGTYQVAFVQAMAPRS